MVTLRFIVGTLLASGVLANNNNNITLPRSSISVEAAARAELYSRADPFNLFGIREPSLKFRDQVGDVIEQGSELARGMSMKERAQQCADAGYGLCPDGTGCCPVGGQCCPGNTCCSKYKGTCTKVYGQYGCCPPGRTCNGIDGCDVGYRACSKDQASCCPTGSSCLYTSGNVAYGCSGSGSGSGGDTGDSGSGFSVTSSAYTSIQYTSSSAAGFTSASFSSFTLDPIFTSASSSSPTPAASSSPSQSSLSVSFPAGGFGGLPMGAAIPNSGSGLGIALGAVVTALIAGFLSL